jgi:hypothetical protein
VDVSVQARGTPRGICGEHNGKGQVFLLVFWFRPVNIIPLWFSILMSLGDEQ